MHNLIRYSQLCIYSVADLVVTAMDPWYKAGELVERLRQENMTLSRAAVAAAEKILGDAGLKTTGMALTGDPKLRIRDEAKEWGQISLWSVRMEGADNTLIVRERLGSGCDERTLFS